MKLLIVGNRGGTNIGGSLERAATRLGLSVRVLEVEEAWGGSRLVRSLHWHFRDRKPNRFAQFNDKLVKLCASWSPDFLLCTGLVPVSANALTCCGGRVIKFNFLTDDPWSPSRRASWFTGSLQNYDALFTPRRANIADLGRITSARVFYLRFGYDSDLFQPRISSRYSKNCCDVIFAGGADADRVPYIAALHASGVDVALYGDYWCRFRPTRRLARGHLGPAALNESLASARTGLCLVRRANRDGHCMRTFEMPAVGVSMLVEKTEDHTEIFGPEWDSVAYFSSALELVDKTRYLLRNDRCRESLLRNAQQLIATGRNTYQDRLSEMLRQVTDLQ